MTDRPSDRERALDLDAIARRAYARLRHELLHELQTAGGLDLGHRGPPGPAAQAELAAIRANVDRLIALAPGAPARVAARLARPGQRILDIGAGRAPWSLALAARAPGARVTAVDLPDQLPALAAAVGAAGMLDRFELVTASVFAGDWPTTADHDLAVIANVCHLFTARANQELIRRAVARLRPGGTLAIIDQVLDDDPDWARWSALYLLGVLHRAPGGRLFPLATYREWLAAAGAAATTVHAVCPLPPLHLIAGVRR